MLKAAKKQLSTSETKDVLIMPSTKNFSALVNKLPLLILIALVIFVGYLAGFGIFLWGSWQVGLGICGGTFLSARAFDYVTQTKKGRKGYIKTTRDTANDLIRAERAYAKLSSDDKALYKNYLEGAYYGDATPEKVYQLFEHKRAEVKSKPKVLDDLLDMELPKD